MSETGPVPHIRKSGFPVLKIGPLDFLRLEDGTHRLSQNIGK